jgi:hypothetical protein
MIYLGHKGDPGEERKGAMKRYLFALGVLALALAAFVVLIQGIRATAADEARVRVAHAVPGGPSIDIKLDGLLVSSNVTYTTVTPYSVLPAGLHQVQILLHGTEIELISETMILPGGMDFTVAGLAAGAAVTTTSLVDNNHPANADTVRIVNFSPDTPAIDVEISGTMTSTVISNTLYKEASSYTRGIGVGVASFEVRASGEITPLLTFTETLDSDTINTVFVMGLTQPPGSFLHPLTKVYSVDQRWPFKVALPLVIGSE